MSPERRAGCRSSDHRHRIIVIGGGKIPHTLKDQLERCWRAAVAAVEPAAAVERALAGDPRPEQPVHVIALGKAAPAMARAATGWLAERGAAVAGGLVVAPRAEGVVTPAALAAVYGDHPLPGPASRTAAEAVARAVHAVEGEHCVMVLLSGGTSSLIAAPVAGVADPDLDQLWRLLLESGLDIIAMNAIRRRFTRWGGGRLAMALAGRHIDVLAISDVPGDDPGSIGSGPCSADRFSAEDIVALLDRAALLARLPPAIAALLRSPETLVPTASPGHPALDRVRMRIVASNADAVRAAADCARDLGANVRVLTPQLTGEAKAAGRHAAEQLVTAPAGSPQAGSTAARSGIVAGGETTVTLARAGADDQSAPSAPLGGRCQELALAAAQVLDGAGEEIALLAAGTDGRDGPTDAAGAIVDGTTWHRIVAAGHDPAAALLGHDSYRALDAAGALFRTGPTGTNVMDLVIGMKMERSAGAQG